MSGFTSEFVACQRILIICDGLASIFISTEQILGRYFYLHRSPLINKIEQLC